MPGRLILVTGMSGAGRSSALRALEDAGLDAVDNLPLHLLRTLLGPAELATPLAVGIDSRTRGFAPDRVLAILAEVRARPGVTVDLLFLECDDETLRRRFTESRRRHPLAQDRPVADGIAEERRLLAPLKAAADLVLDTTAMSLTELRRLVTGQLAPAAAAGLTVSLLSFAFRHGLPREADLVLDMRFLRNPHYDPALRPLTGHDRAVQEHIDADPDAAPTIERVLALLVPLLPRYAAEGKSYLTIAVGCTGGQHRSVYVTEVLSSRLRREGWQTSVVHRDLQAAIAAAIRAQAS